MKEMKYSKERKIEVLATGYCFGLLYYILNLGTHPTAYIKIPGSINIDKDKLDVHGGITYSKNHLWISENQKIDGEFIGWDYGHYGDYAGYEEILPKEIRTGGKKWTTTEIYKEVREVCYQIKKGGKIMNEKAKYTEVNEEQNNRIDDVRNMFSDVYDFIESNCKSSRETSLAMTKIEEAQFWAIKGITREKQKENQNITGSMTDENGNLLF
ncbi:MAG: hypothetical protein ACLUT6_06385 [Clostridia bacterium]